MTLNQAKDNFIKSRKRMCCSDKTIRSYNDTLSMFIRFTGDKEVSANIKEDILKFNDYIIEKRLAIATIASYLRQLKAFFNYLESINVIPEGSIVKHIKIPRTPKKDIVLLSAADINLIFDSIQEESDWLIVRDKLSIALMYDNGLRQEEVCRIMYRDIDFSRNMLLVHGKGNKDRFVTFGNTTLEILNLYIVSCPFKTEYLMCDRRGKKLSENAIKKFMQKLKETTGITDLSSHKLRHNFATNWCLNSLKKYGHVDTLQLMTVMGHGDLKTTERYIHEAYQMISAINQESHLDSIMTAKV